MLKAKCPVCKKELNQKYTKNYKGEIFTYCEDCKVPLKVRVDYFTTIDKKYDSYWSLQDWIKIRERN